MYVEYFDVVLSFAIDKSWSPFWSFAIDAGTGYLKFVFNLGSEATPFIASPGRGPLRHAVKWENLRL
jgi:hypothetical protein